jgi:hypothetical protein
LLIHRGWFSSSTSAASTLQQLVVHILVFHLRVLIALLFGSSFLTKRIRRRVLSALGWINVGVKPGIQSKVIRLINTLLFTWLLKAL